MAMRRCLTLFTVLAHCVGSHAADESAVLRRYAMSTETGMPNLEANLRYAVVKEERCLDPSDLSKAFWMLRDVSLQDCQLVKYSEAAERATYVLQCTGGHGTSGEAHWQITPTALTGTLNVRLGGKNMTFFQRITAKLIGPSR